MTDLAEAWDSIPDEWKVDVVRLRGGGRDNDGIPQPETETVLVGCLVGWRQSLAPVENADVTRDFITLFMPFQDVDDWQDNDRVRIPAGPWPSGSYALDGYPKAWPAAGWEIQLRKDAP